MSDSYIYSPNDLAEMFGLNTRHLTRDDGPISRILTTYYWKKNELSPDGEALTEEGAALLNEYLTECGKNGKTKYKDWQTAIWEREGKNPDQSESAIVPLVDVSIAELPAVNIGDCFGNLGESFEATINQLAQANYQRGKQLARQLVTPLYQGFAEEYQQLNQQGLEFINKMGAK